MCMASLTTSVNQAYSAMTTGRHVHNFTLHSTYMDERTRQKAASSETPGGDDRVLQGPPTR
jgi:hypothetical protein